MIILTGRGLASAAAADDRKHLATLHLEARLVDGCRSVETVTHLIYFQQDAHCPFSPIWNAVANRDHTPAGDKQMTSNHRRKKASGLVLAGDSSSTHHLRRLPSHRHFRANQ
jgi:hypothetical protein